MQRHWTRARQLRNASTDAERRLWYFLRRRQLAGHKFRRQYPLAGYIVDFVCVPARLVIELDGGQHLDALAYDQRRTEALRREGYRVLRFWNDDVLLRTDDVVAEIFRVLEEARATPPQPSPTA
jgi:very-short-patch-repair endonuclease